MDETEIMILSMAYMRRIKFESRLQAVEIMTALNEAMGNGGERVAPEAMLAMMGGL
jgi:hypothetical protein